MPFYSSKQAKQDKDTGFTLIELLVVVAIIGLLSSIALIAFMEAREKSRDAKRLGDMVQMNTALELYFAGNKGYPSSTAGIPQGMTPAYLASLPTIALPADGACQSLPHGPACTVADPSCTGVPANKYWYIPSGTAFIGPEGNTVYPDYSYYFCLGSDVNNIPAGERTLTPRGIR